MKDYSEVVSDVCQLEQDLDLYKYKIIGVPIWRIVRRKYRDRYTDREIGVGALNNHSQFHFCALLKSYLISVKQILKLLLKNEYVDNVIFGFPRLENVNGIYLDKFIDPVLLESNLKNSYIYIERGRSGEHLTPRLNNEKIFFSEFIDFTSQLLGGLIVPLVFMFNLHKFIGIYQKTKDVLGFNYKDVFETSYRTSVFVLQVYFLKLIFKRIHAKRFFGVAIGNHYHYIVASRKIGIPVYEFQHGIIVGQTTLYTGVYDPQMYPDYFLAWGKSSMMEFFGVPLSRMINIGWAFKSYLVKHIPKVNYPDNTYLIVSDPEVTHIVIKTAMELAQTYLGYEFHIRLHPHEKLNKEQEMYVLQCKNISIQDNRINSNVALLSYCAILGENSTVMYEALSLGKKVGRLCFNGFNPIAMSGISKDAFYDIRDVNDFANFVTWKRTESLDDNMIYSDFCVDVVNRLL